MRKARENILPHGENRSGKSSNSEMRMQTPKDFTVTKIQHFQNQVSSLLKSEKCVAVLNKIYLYILGLFLFSLYKSEEATLLNRNIFFGMRKYPVTPVST